MKKTLYTIIALMLVITVSKAQSIPNAGFENWTTMTGYNNPDGWGNLNNSTAPLSIYTCEKGTPGSVGTAYLKLTSKTAGPGVAPGIAVSGVIDSLTQMPKSGFAYSTRSAFLTGKWQHMISGTSQGFIDVKMTRWDNSNHVRVTVDSAHQVLSGMAMSWAAFSIPLTYLDSGTPDTCIIVLSASGISPTNGDYLWVDALAFSGTEGISENQFDANISLFPNPASESLMLDLSALKEQKVSVTILDMQGKLVKSVENTAVSSKTIIDIAGLSKGNYVINVIAKEGTVSRKFVKQ